MKNLDSIKDEFPQSEIKKHRKYILKSAIWISITLASFFAYPTYLEYQKSLDCLSEAYFKCGQSDDDRINETFLEGCPCEHIREMYDSSNN